MPSPASSQPAGDKDLMTRQRRERIVELARAEGSVRVADLATRFGVSSVTIRSDLLLLDEEGVLVRDHGGARPSDAGTYVNSLLGFEQRAALNLDKKRRIGAEAARRVHPGDTILLDAGTTAVEIAKRVTTLAPLTVVTNALNVAAELGTSANTRLILLGGIFDRDSSSTLGGLTEQALAELSVQKLFLGTQAFNADGLTDSTMEIAQAKRAMIRSARQVILVTDSSKWDSSGLIRVSPLGDIDTIITDDGLPEEARRQIEALGVELVIV